MNISHIALWVKDLEKIKNFYCEYFKVRVSALYHNKDTEFKSYFLTFESGAKLELMFNPNICIKQDKNCLGYGHIAIGLGSKEQVDIFTEKLKNDGFAVISMPRFTGDGFYESVILDPEGNKIELTV